MSLSSGAGAWPFIALIVLVGAGLFAFSVIGITTSLYTATGIACLAVGLAMLLRGQTANIGLLVIFLGLGLWLGGDYLPEVTIADSLTFVGIEP